MADAWDEAEKQANESGGDFIKLDDGASVVLAILGKPEPYEAKPFKDGDQPSKKFLLNAWKRDEKKLGIADMAAMTFKELCAHRKDFPFDKYFVKMRRTGKGNKTRYSFAPIVEPITPEQAKFFAQLDMKDLSAVAGRIEFQGDDEPQAAPPRRREAPGAPAPQRGAGADMAKAMDVDPDSVPF